MASECVGWCIGVVWWCKIASYQTVRPWNRRPCWYAPIRRTRPPGPSQTTVKINSATNPSSSAAPTQVSNRLHAQTFPAGTYAIVTCSSRTPRSSCSSAQENSPCYIPWMWWRWMKTAIFCLAVARNSAISRRFRGTYRPRSKSKRYQYDLCFTFFWPSTQLSVFLCHIWTEIQFNSLVSDVEPTAD